jgi:hypothetical protein
VAGNVRYSDDWGAGRAGGRSHQGNDLMGTKLQPLLAAADGVISWARVDGSGNGGNLIALKDRDGWEYWYIHVNNDTPGTDDGTNPPAWNFWPGVHVGSNVVAGQPIAYMGDSGDAEPTAPHLHFEMHQPDRTAIDPYQSLRVAWRSPDTVARDVATNPEGGYYVLTGDGRIHAFDGAPTFGEPAFGWNIARSMAVMPDGKGYVVLDGWGGVHPYGSAVDALATRPTPYWPNFDIARRIRLMPDAKGYVVLDGYGGVHRAGSARTALAGLTNTYWYGWDIARAVEVSSTGKGVAVLDAWGAVHTAGDASLHSPGSRPGDRWISLSVAGTRIHAVQENGQSARW